jgi:hypothetical protein
MEFRFDYRLLTGQRFVIKWHTAGATGHFCLAREPDRATLFK